MRPTATIDLSRHFDCSGIEPGRCPGEGGFNIWGNTFPAEQLPSPGTLVSVGGFPFVFPPAGAGEPDNVRCRGQRIPLPEAHADWIYLLGAAERRTEDEVTVHYAGGATRRQWLRLSDFWPETPAWFGEPLAFRTSFMLYPRHVDAKMSPAFWLQRVPLAVPDGLVAVTLPENPAMHIFAMTMVSQEAPGP